MAGETPERFESVAQIEGIADRAIREGQDRGEFDDLPGHGRPIPDLDTERPSGWWASRWIEAEKLLVAAEDLRRDRQSERNRALHLTDVGALRQALDELNDRIAAHNRATTRREQYVEPVDIHDAISVWYRLRRAKQRPTSRWGLSSR